jgi:UDP-glucose-4-epimerase GalE
MSQPQILVTGGAGYIGSHTCKALAHAGYTPIVVDNLQSGKKEFVKWGPLFIGDIEDKGFLKSVFSKHKFEAVIHFASLINVGESVQNPMLYYSRNIIPSIRLLETMIEFNVRKMIFSSTCAVYGSPKEVPITESAPQNPLNPYGKTKWTVEGLLSDLATSGEMGTVSLRYFNACGADVDGEIGEAHDPETHLIPLAIRAAFDPNYTLNVNGNTYSTPDGTCVRDYIHVHDLAEAHVLSLKFLTNTSQFEAFNLGSAKGYSIYEIINAIENVSGRKVKHVLQGPRPGDPPILIANSSKIQSQLNWKPKSNLETIVKTAIDWHKREF